MNAIIYQISVTQVNHTLSNCCQYCYSQLTKSSDEMSTKTSLISVLVVIWSNFRHSFSFIDEN